MGFAHERVGLQAARVNRLLRVMRDCADIEMRKMCSAGPVTECLRPVLHHAVQRTALHAMQPMLSIGLPAGRGSWSVDPQRFTPGDVKECRVART